MKPLLYPSEAVVLTKWLVTSNPAKAEIALHLEAKRVMPDGKVQEIVTSIVIPASDCEQLAQDVRAAALKAAQ